MNIAAVLQVDLVCHGMTEVVPDKDGSDPYEVRKSPLFVSVLVLILSQIKALDKQISFCGMWDFLSLLTTM